jgi:hypothetical protein
VSLPKPTISAIHFRNRERKNRFRRYRNLCGFDSPSGGMIRVKPLNLHALADSMRPN